MDHQPYKIPFNKPYLTGNELTNIHAVVESGKWGGNGRFTQLCEQFLEEKFGFGKCLLTTSCTSALEMAAILLDIKKGDEVIVPSFTFVSTANAFASRGATIVFADCIQGNPNMDITNLKSLITKQTKVIVPVHYAGISYNMPALIDFANEHGIYVVEDAAQALAFYEGEKALGTYGHLAAFSFHETKHISCGEGGMLVVNNNKWISRAEIIREKGTNRSAFLRDEIEEYSWVDLGSSYLLSEFSAAFLLAQLHQIDDIMMKRKIVYTYYVDALKSMVNDGFLTLPNHSCTPQFMYAFCKDRSERDSLIDFLKVHKIQASFHYLPLHLSTFVKNNFKQATLPNASKIADTIIRFPFYTEMTQAEISEVGGVISNFFKKY